MVDWSRVSLPGLGPGGTVLVSGATGGLGRATVEAFASLGMGVAMFGRSRERLDEFTVALGDRAFGVVCDITDPAQVDAAVAEVSGRVGTIDVFVHCAAISEGNVPIHELSDRQIEVVVRVNVLGTLYLARAVSRKMIEQKRGRIVMVSSVAAHQAMPGRNVYGPTKAVVSHVTRQLAVELGPHGITVNAVSPGQTPTHIRLVDDEPGTPPRPKANPQGEAGVENIPLRRRGELDDFVGPILFYASDLASYTTGSDLLVDGGATVLR